MVLEINQTWRQDGIEVVITPPSELTPDKVLFGYRITNRRAGDTIFRFNISDVMSVVDSTGRRMVLQDADGGSEHSFSLRSGQSRERWVAWKGDLTRRDVTEVVVIVNGIANVTNARWRIPIYH
jgi:hypothetical protein